jgi:predicted dehydrogenase
MFMSAKPASITRRAFLVNSAAATLGTSLASDALSAPAVQSSRQVNEKIRVGFIGVGNRGSQLLAGFLAQNDCQVAALCDVYQPYLARNRSQVDPEIFKSIGDGLVPKMGEPLDPGIARYSDFRKLLEQKDLDAVVVATPDHWHAIQTIMAFDAGKDVYVEKPLTATIPEGRKMVQAQQRTGRIAQVGLHRRSSKLYAHLHDLVQQGKIGKVVLASSYRISDMSPVGIGRYPDAEPPHGFDWDMWLGPRAVRPYRYSLAPYKFRWWKDYSSQMGNWGVHYCDAIRWLLDEQAPTAISAHGGRYAIQDDRTIPDTLEVTFEFASGRILKFGQYEALALTGMDPPVLTRTDPPS